MRNNELLKGITLGAGLITGLIVFLITAIFLLIVGSAMLNSIRLNSSSPLTHYILNLEEEQPMDVSHFFETSASKEEVFAVLSAQEYSWNSWLPEPPELDPQFDLYTFSRSLSGCGWGNVNARLSVKFDENDRFVSAKGSRSKCYM